jgi:hypothetical protein
MRSMFDILNKMKSGKGIFKQFMNIKINGTIKLSKNNWIVKKFLNHILYACTNISVCIFVYLNLFSLQGVKILNIFHKISIQIADFLNIIIYKFLYFIEI